MGRRPIPCGIAVTCLNPLLFGIVPNFDETRPHDTKLLEGLCEAEVRLSDGGAIDPDFSIKYANLAVSQRLLGSNSGTRRCSAHYWR